MANGTTRFTQATNTVVKLIYLRFLTSEMIGRRPRTCSAATTDRTVAAGQRKLPYGNPSGVLHRPAVELGPQPHPTRVHTVTPPLAPSQPPNWYPFSPPPTVSPRRWMRSQTRLALAFVFLKLFTGSRPSGCSRLRPVTPGASLRPGRPVPSGWRRNQRGVES